MNDGPNESQQNNREGSGLARHAAINLLGGVFAPLASFATAPILAHALSVEGRGQLAAATTPFALTVTLATIGLPEAVTFFIAQDRGRTTAIARRAILLCLAPAAVAAAVLFAASHWISGNDPTVRRLIVASAALIIPSLVLAVIRAVAAAHNKWTTITTERVITAFTKLIPLTVLFALGELDLVAAAIVLILSTLAGAVVYLPLVRQYRSGLKVGVVSKGQLLRFGGGIWLGTVSGVLLMRIDQVLMAPLAGAFQLGLYAVAVSISELPLMVNSALRETAFTHLSHRGVRPAEVGDLSRVSTIIVLTLCLAVGATSPVLVPLAFGRDFAAAVPVLYILLIAVCLGNPGSLAGVALSSSGHPHLRSSALVVACAVNIALLFLLAPSHGAVGAAVATLAGNIVSSNISIAFTVKRCGASIGDYYNFRARDFASVVQLVCRVLRALRRRPG